MNRAAIELDIFSGRVNPGWEISLEESLELYDQMVQFPETERTEFPDRLGYRGFVLTIDQTGEQRIVCTIFSTLVKIVKGSIREYKRDNEKKIEHRLLESARRNIDDQLFMMVEREVRKR